MKNTYQNIAIWSVIILIVTLGVAGRWLRQDHVVLNDLTRKGLITEAQINFDAPLYEIVTMPIPRVDSYNTQTHTAVVGMYSWFGLRVGGVTMNDCGYQKIDILTTHETTFGCGGGTNQYLF